MPISLTTWNLLPYVPYNFNISGARKNLHLSISGSLIMASSWRKKIVWLGVVLCLANSSGVSLYAKNQNKHTGRGIVGSKGDDPACYNCLSQAATLFAANKLTEAAALIDEWVERCPNNSSLHLMQSNILLRLGELNRAQDAAHSAVEANPASVAAHLQYGLCLLNGKRLMQAAEEFKTVTEMDPGNYECWSALSDIYKQLHEDTLSKEAEIRASELEPGTRKIRLAVLNNLKNSGKYAAAEKEVRRLIDTTASPELLLPLCEEAVAVGAYDDAISAADKILAVYPKCIQALRAQAVAFFLKRQWSRCLAVLDKLFLVSSNDPELFALKGLSLLSLGKPAEAELAISTAVKLDATAPASRLALGRLYQSRGNLEGAVELFKSCADGPAQRSNIAIPFAHLALANIYRKQQLFDQAIGECHAAAYDPRFRSLSSAMEARALLSADKGIPGDKVSSLMKQALLTDASIPDALLAESILNLKQAQKDKARENAHKAAQCEPGYGDSLIVLAQVASVEGNKEEYTRLLRQALVLSVADPEALRLLAVQELKH